MKSRFIFILIILNILFLLSGCGKKINTVEDYFNGNISDLEGVNIEILEASKDTITYVISNSSDTSLFYEGHRFARLQKEEDQYWYDLEFGEVAETAIFMVAEIPESQESHTLSVKVYYGAGLESGHYRLLAECYPSLDDLYKGEESTKIFLAKDFTIK